MGTTVKSFFQSFSEIPEGKFPPKYYTPRLLRALVSETMHIHSVYYHIVCL